MSRYALCLDPGLASCGYALVYRGAGRLVAFGLGVIRTEKSDKKRSVLAADDNVRRARELYAAIQRTTCFDVHDNRDVPSVICAEAMSFPRSASAAGKMSLAWGVVSSYAELYGIPIVQASPKEVKRGTGLAGTASKAEVGTAVRKAFPESVEMFKKLRQSVHEHAQDALAVALACQRSDVFMAAMRPS